ncbi:SurA N-terminal domain-containing protein [Candidatus Saccharibacteria bacterium]|jgi:parvulin-like peptidyl-prolyl isomerase|nr:SurA N-terminal domain-containing protein [Candidatus Saccharibacteria bacterium]
MAKKRLKKLQLRRKKVRELIPDSISEKAMTLNPLPTSSEPQVVQNVPRITNETITEHREEVLKGARKYIYPLQHSKHRIVMVTLSITAMAVAAFLIYCTLALYRFYQNNTFLYRVTQVVPFPIARVDGDFVSYENYLFELRHFVHYYQTQQQLNFNGPDREQLVRFRKQALDSVINDALVKKLARQNGVTVSSREVDNRINEVRNQNRLGNNNKVFADVLRDYWGWSVSDFKRSLKQEILSEKVSAKLDKGANSKADAALLQIRNGADFGEVAKSVSEDQSKSAGGDFGFAITKTNPNVPPEVVDALFKLKPGEVSNVILASPVIAGAPPTLQIVKVTQNDGKTISALHIVFNLKDSSVYVKELRKSSPPKTYVNL